MKPDTCYWDEELGRLEGNKGTKVRQMLRENLISMGLGVGEYSVAPSAGRHLTHTVNVLEKNCTCQAFKANGQDCSHILAVRIYVGRLDGTGGGRSANV